MCTAWEVPCHTLRHLFIQWYRLIASCFIPFRSLSFSVLFLQSFASTRVPLPPLLTMVAVHSICISVAEELFLWWQPLSPQSILVWHHNTTRRSESRALCLLMGRSPPTGSSTACILSCFHLILSPRPAPLSFPSSPLSSSFRSPLIKNPLSVCPPLPLQSSLKPSQLLFSPHQPLLSLLCSLPLVCLF